MRTLTDSGIGTANLKADARLAFSTAMSWKSAL